MRKYNGAMAFLEFFSNLIRRVPHFTLLGSRLRGNDESFSWGIGIVTTTVGAIHVGANGRSPQLLDSRLRGNDVG
jgi:hypothetical protein